MITITEACKRGCECQSCQIIRLKEHVDRIELDNEQLLESLFSLLKVIEEHGNAVIKERANDIISTRAHLSPTPRKDGTV